MERLAKRWRLEYSSILKFQKFEWWRHISEKCWNGHFNKKRVKEQNNNVSCADENNFIEIEEVEIEEKQQQIAENELQLLCCYNSCKAVANNGEG